eukprot:3050318-Lingulodinium_polyedra.AAC.1
MVMALVLALLILKPMVVLMVMLMAMLMVMAMAMVGHATTLPTKQSHGVLIAVRDNDGGATHARG